MIEKGFYMITHKKIRLLLWLLILSALHSSCFTQSAELAAQLENAVDSKNIQLVKNLLDQGAHPDGLYHYGYINEPTPLIKAAHNNAIEIINLLIKAGAHVDTAIEVDQPHIGKNALRFALDAGSYNALTTLVRNGANPNSFTEYAIEFEHIATHTPTLLLYSIVRLQETRIKRNAIAQKEWETRINTFLQQPNLIVDTPDLTSHVTPLMAAAYFGLYTYVQKLLEHGAQVDTIDKKNQNALYYAKKTGDQSLIALLSSAQKQQRALRYTRYSILILLICGITTLVYLHKKQYL